MESTESWNKTETLAEARGCHVLAAIDKCVPVTTFKKVLVPTLDSIYDAVCDSANSYRIRHGKK